MATTRTSVRVQRDACGLTSVLSSAVLEWLLICLLFLDALFSYVVTKFACFCELQTPCLFCSRLDHILGSEKPGFYRDLICHAHKMEISKLVYCCLHEKLSDAGVMCEGCISSITTGEKSDYGACKSSVGKLDPFIEYCVDNDHNIHLNSPATEDGDSLQISFHGDDLLKDPLLKGSTVSSSCMRLCSCCSEPLTKTFPLRLVRSKSIESTELDVPSSVMMKPGPLHHRVGLKKRRDKLPRSKMVSNWEDRGSDPLPYVGYTELEIISDSESEVPISDDEGRNLVCDTDDLKEGPAAQSVQQETETINVHISPKIAPSDLDPGKLIHDILRQEPSFSVPLEVFHIGTPHDGASLASAAAISNGLEVLNCNQDETKGSSPEVSKPISPDEFSLLDNVKESLLEVTKEKLDNMGISDMVCISGTENKEVSKQGCGSIANNSTVKIGQTMNEMGRPMPDCMDLNDAYKLVVGSKANQPPTAFTELLNGKDSTSINDDLKLLLSQMSAVRGFELSWSDISPRVDGHGDDSKTSDISSAIGLQILPKRLSIERHESGFVSFDESLLSEIEGERTIDRLKRQVELDRKSLNALYKELEEERSASAIAANQAMAMINRLQEEKAAMQMEAFQYQRMMEEQVEYDQEALQKSNDLLADREKEIQDLEEELEIYRERYPSDLKVEKISELTSDSRGIKMRAASYDNNTDYRMNRTGIPKESLLDFENEKLYILKCLKRLENNLHPLSTNGVPINSSELDSPRVGFQDDKCVDMTLHGFSEEQGWPLFADNENRNGGFPRMESLGGGDVEEIYSMTSTKNDLVAVSKQISHLNERLKTLEEDWNFLEHTVNSLRNGNEGLHFVQEIASHLRELRMNGMGTREQAVA
ncbi:hypothetical protein AAC387_Pa07g0953 [Persea americana]